MLTRSNDKCVFLTGMFAVSRGRLTQVLTQFFLTMRSNLVMAIALLFWLVTLAELIDCRLGGARHHDSLLHNGDKS